MVSGMSWGKSLSCSIIFHSVHVYVQHVHIDNIHTYMCTCCTRYGSTFLLLLLPFSFRVPFAVVCMPSCALLSNVSFDSHGCSNVSCGIDCMHAMDVLLFWVCHRSRNREGWVLSFLLVDLMFSD